MSAFIISKPTMDQVVTAIDQHFNHVHRSPTVGGIGLGDLDALGVALYAMNTDAVSQRYRGETKDTLPGPIDTSDIHENYRHRMDFDHTTIRGLKAISCLRYQASEGDVPETSELYTDLDKLANTIAYEIVADLPEYRDAPWDA